MDITNKYSCKYCDKEFNDSQALHKHTYYLHISKKKYICEYCGKYEYSKAILKQHINSCASALESGFEPELFDCDLCDKSFKQKGNLHSHREKMHNIQKPHTRITRNKIRKTIMSERYSVKENTNIKSPKRFYIIDSKKNIDYEIIDKDIKDTDIIKRLNVIDKYVCKAISKIWCDNLNIIDGFYNINWDSKNDTNFEKVFNIWSSFNNAINSLKEDRPKQSECIETCLDIICKDSDKNH